MARRKSFAKTFGIEERQITLADCVDNPERYRRYLGRVRHLLDEKRGENGGRLPRREWLLVKRFFNQAACRFYADPLRLQPNLNATAYLEDHFGLTLAHDQMNRSRGKIVEGFLNRQRHRITNKATQWQREKERLVQATYMHHVESKLSYTRSKVEAFGKLLHWRNPRIIRELMAEVDFGPVTETFPLWVGEMRHLGDFLPFTSELFDLVIVDEASQVNIAEIIPAFYRGQRFCVVGDKDSSRFIVGRDQAFRRRRGCESGSL